MATRPGADPYLLERGWVESIRLDAQHVTLKKRVGWTLHPRLTEHIEANISNASSSAVFRVADVATGTGIAALDLSAEFPAAAEQLSITALDISAIQFPNPITVPSNVHFGLYNLFEPPPPEYTAAFDVVHIRLLVAALVNGGQETVLHNLRAMLKPGGLLQWSENPPPFWGPVDLQSIQLEGELTRFHILTEPYAKLFEKVAWIKDLECVVRNAGFEEVEGYIPPVRKEVSSDESRLVLWLATNASKIRKSMVPEALHGKQDSCVQELEENVRDGRLLAYYLNIVTARKPL